MPQSKEKRTLQALIEDLGLDTERFDTERKGDTTLAKVKADIDLGIRLGIDGTPSVFINGRRVYDTRAQALQYLITHEMEHMGHAHDHE